MINIEHTKLETHGGYHGEAQLDALIIHENVSILMDFTWPSNGYQTFCFAHFCVMQLTQGIFFSFVVCGGFCKMECPLLT